MNGWQATVVITVFWVIMLNSLLMAPWLGRLAEREGLPYWIGWVPILNTVVPARAADCSLWAWFLLFVPIVDLYVWWDWWGTMASDKYHPRPDWFALGMFVPGLSAWLLAGFIRETDTRANGLGGAYPVGLKGH